MNAPTDCSLWPPVLLIPIPLYTVLAPVRMGQKHLLALPREHSSHLVDAFRASIVLPRAFHK